jgi:hypothetical protein
MPVTLLADLAGAERVCTAVLLVMREPPGMRQLGLGDSLEARRGARPVASRRAARS